MTDPDFSEFYKKYIGSGEDYDASLDNSELIETHDDYADTEDLVQAG